MIQRCGKCELLGKPRESLENRFADAVEVLGEVVNYGRIFLNGTTYYGSIYKRMKSKKADVVAYRDGGEILSIQK